MVTTACEVTVSEPEHDHQMSASQTVAVDSDDRLAAVRQSVTAFQEDLARRGYRRIAIESHTLVTAADGQFTRQRTVWSGTDDELGAVEFWFELIDRYHAESEPLLAGIRASRNMQDPAALDRFRTLQTALCKSMLPDSPNPCDV